MVQKDAKNQVLNVSEAHLDGPVQDIIKFFSQECSFVNLTLATLSAATEIANAPLSASMCELVESPKLLYLATRMLTLLKPFSEYVESNQKEG